MRAAGLGGTAHSAARERTRTAVVDTALRLFSERGYSGVRVEDIAREAGVSRATFYKYFCEREAILAALLDRLLGTEDAATPTGPGEPAAEKPAPGQDAHEQVRRVVHGELDRMMEQERLARFVYSLPVRHEALLRGASPRIPAVLRRINRVVEDGVASGYLRDDVPVDMLCRHVRGVLETAMRDWAAQRGGDPHTHLDQILDLTFRGVQVPRRPR